MDRQTRPHDADPASPRDDAGAVFREHAAFVWRSLAQLGVPQAALDDAVQNVFVVVMRRLGGFEGRASHRTWLFRIAMRVASDVRRAARRQRIDGPVDDVDPPDPSPGPDDRLAAREAHALVLRTLDALEDDRRAIFVLTELQQMSVSEAAEMLGVNVNTASSRLRAARADFEAALRRQKRSP